jgi:predicted ATP-grasp superfamily ATP-dependent carboligase
MLGITRQLAGTPWAGADGFRYVGSIGPLRPAGRIVDALRKIGMLLANAFGLVGLFGVDAVVRNEMVWTVEVNPRYTASVEILERALGIRAVTMHISACCQEPLPDEPDWRSGGCYGKAIVYAPRNASMPEKVSRELAQRASDSAWPLFADIPAPGVPIRARSPIATVFARGKDVPMVEKRLRRRVAMLERLVL